MDYRHLFESFPDALIVVDAEGRIVLANPRAEAVFGYPAQGMAGLPVETLIPEGIRERHRSHRADYMANPRQRPMDLASGIALTGQRRDGQRFPVEIALSPMRSDQGAVYLASVRDISATALARRVAVRARYDALEARIGRLALESLDEHRVIEELPALLAEAQGVEAVAVGILPAERGLFELLATFGFRNHPMRFPMPATPLWRALADGLPFIIEDLAERAPEEHAWPDNDGAGGSLAMMPLLGREGVLGALIVRAREPRHFDHDAVHLLRSIANLLAALLQRRRTEEQLAHSQRLDAIGQLTGGIAHDFNNLLTIVSGSLQLLEMELAERPQATELVAGALRSVKRGAQLTSKLLAFARRQRLQPRAVAVDALLRDLELMLQSTLGETIELEVRCAPGLPAAHADATQLDTALVNLVLNARDAMPRGGRIAIEASERGIFLDESGPELGAGNYVVITVSDTGRGMTPETATKAMEPFFTTKGVGHGTGLGLSMAYGFAKQSGGHLRLESRLGYGTRVELFLPAEPASEGARPTSAAAARKAEPGGGETILVVEDEAEVLKLAAVFLRSLGYRVHCASNAEQAMRILEEEPEVSLLFSDLMLGSGARGDELAHSARELRPGLSVLLTSGYEQAAGESPGGRDFPMLRKPYFHEDLSVVIRGLLDQGA